MTKKPPSPRRSAFKNAKRNKKTIKLRNLDFLHVHIQTEDIGQGNLYKNCEDILTIFISNSGEVPINIQKAFLMPYKLILNSFKIRSKIPVHSKAFKSASHDAYEINFGKNLDNFKIKIEPGARVSTYLPLCKPIDPNIINTKKLGTIMIEYSTSYKDGIHIVLV